MNIIGETIQNGEPSPEHPVEIENKTNILLAIEILKKLKTARHHIQVDKPDGGEEIFELPYLSSIEQQAIETVLSELGKKEKLIDLIKKDIESNIYLAESNYDIEELTNYARGMYDTYIDMRKKYFNKVEREGK